MTSRISARSYQTYQGSVRRTFLSRLIPVRSLFSHSVISHAIIGVASLCLFLTSVGCERECIIERIEATGSGLIYESGAPKKVEFEGRLEEDDISPVEYFQIRDGLITSGAYGGKSLQMSSSEGYTFSIEFGELVEGSDTMQGVDGGSLSDWGQALDRPRRGTSLVHLVGPEGDYELLADSVNVILINDEAPLEVYLNMLFVAPSGEEFTMAGDLKLGLISEEGECE